MVITDTLEGANIDFILPCSPSLSLFSFLSIYLSVSPVLLSSSDTALAVMTAIHIEFLYSQKGDEGEAFEGRKQPTVRWQFIKNKTPEGVCVGGGARK